MVRSRDRKDYEMLLEVLISYVYTHLLGVPRYRALLLGDAGCVIDGGANSGAHTIPLCRLIGSSGTVHAFEPIPLMREKLLGYMAWAKTSSAPLNLHAEALSDSVGTLRFVVDAINPALSHIVNAWDNVEKLTSAGSQIIEVDVVTLDSILPGIAPAFMKFDLEGADFLGLRGARDSIVRGHPIIFFESLMDRAAKMYGYTKEEFLAFFDGIGYDIYSLHGFPLTPDIWGSDDYGYESIALPRGAEISREVLDLTNFFWAEIGNKPEIENWNESTAILRAVFGWIEARP